MPFIFFIIVLSVMFFFSYIFALLLVDAELPVLSLLLRLGIKADVSSVTRAKCV